MQKPVSADIIVVVICRVKDDVHVLIPIPCKYVRLHGKRELSLQIELRSYYLTSIINLVSNTSITLK